MTTLPYPSALETTSAARGSSLEACRTTSFSFLMVRSNLGLKECSSDAYAGFGLDAGHPLGRQWHLTFYPRQDQGFSYLGLTMEHYCKNSSLVPPEGRIDRIYILGKERSYLHPPAIQMFDLGVWERVSRKTGVGFTIGTIQKDDLDAMSLPPGIEDIGSQTRDDFIGQISRHRALLGIGSPPQPSSPLEALCLGTPFINRA